MAHKLDSAHYPYESEYDTSNYIDAGPGSILLGLTFNVVVRHSAPSFLKVSYRVFFKLNKPRFLERYICASLFHRLQALRRYVDRDFFAEFGKENGLFLHIHLAAALASGVKFGRTSTVGVPAAHLRLFAGDIACPCHSRVIVPQATL